MYRRVIGLLLAAALLTIGAGTALLLNLVWLRDSFSLVEHTNEVLLRISTAEVGLFNGANTYVGNFEVLWRFTTDEEVATPYIGGGLALAGRDGCGTDPGCPGLWLNAVFGFELHYRSTFNWLVEYHGMDAMRRHRLYVGLTTRRGN